MRIAGAVFAFFTGSMVLTFYGVPWGVRLAAMLLGAAGGLLAAATPSPAPAGGAPLTDLELRRLEAAADILASDEYDGREVAALMRRAVAALRSVAGE
jgi:hypothetical protein